MSERGKELLVGIAKGFVLIFVGFLMGLLVGKQ